MWEIVHAVPSCQSLLPVFRCWDVLVVPLPVRGIAGLLVHMLLRYIQIEGSLGEKASLCIRGFKACDAYSTTLQVALAAFSIAGATFTVFAPASQQGESFELGLVHSREAEALGCLLSHGTGGAARMVPLPSASLLLRV